MRSLQLKCFNFEVVEMCSLVFIDSKSASVQVVAWHLFGAKPLPEPKMTNR